MTPPKRTEEEIFVDRVFLHLNNPRHEPYSKQAEVIEYLCRHENVLPLARDIVRNGLNPLERFAMLAEEGHQTGSEQAYIVTEGNRRMCAIKLLNDPDLAPSDMRESFRNLAIQWDRFATIPAVVFEDQDDLDLWLRRIHHGAQGGVGRKDWNAEQKQRHSGSSKNKVSLALLDYAQKKEFLSQDNRKGKLTTVQRYVGNPIFREALGIDISQPDDICRTRTEQDFDLLLSKFFSDLLNRPNEVSSRSNRDQIVEYARELDTTDGQSRKRVHPKPIGTGQEEEQEDHQSRPTKPRRPTRLPHIKDIEAKLSELGNYKLQHLYSSLCRIPLQENTPLLAVGAWAFIETLTASAGRNSSTSFPSFFSNARLNRYGIPKGTERNTINAALNRISEYGNTTKHHRTAAAFNSEQLFDDFNTLGELILICTNDALKEDTNS